MLHKSKILTAKGVRILGGTLHFTLKTAADLVLAGEVKALKGLNVYEMTENELVQVRLEITRLKQYKLKKISKTLLIRKKSPSKFNEASVLI